MQFDSFAFFGPTCLFLKIYLSIPANARVSIVLKPDVLDSRTSICTQTHTLSRARLQHSLSQTHIWRTAHTSALFTFQGRIEKSFHQVIRRWLALLLCDGLPLLCALLVLSPLRNYTRHVFGRMTLHLTSTGYEPNTSLTKANMDTSGARLVPPVDLTRDDDDTNSRMSDIPLQLPAGAVSNRYHIRQDWILGNYTISFHLLKVYFPLNNSALVTLSQAGRRRVKCSQTLTDTKSDRIESLAILNPVPSLQSVFAALGPQEAFQLLAQRAWEALHDQRETARRAPLRQQGEFLAATHQYEASARHNFVNTWARTSEAHNFNVQRQHDFLMMQVKLLKMCEKNRVTEVIWDVWRRDEQENDLHTELSLQTLHSEDGWKHTSAFVRIGSGNTAISRDVSRISNRSAVLPNLTFDFDAKIESQKSEARRIKRILQTTQESLSSREGSQSPFDSRCLCWWKCCHIICYQKSGTSNQSSTTSWWRPRAVSIKRAYIAERSFNIVCSSEYTTSDNLENSNGSSHFFYSDDPFTNWECRSYRGRPWLWRISRERSRVNHAWHLASTKRIQKSENQLQKRSCLILRNISQSTYAVDGWNWGCSKYWRADYCSICHRKTNTGHQQSSRLQADPGTLNRKLQETSHHSRRQSSIGEEITYRQIGLLGWTTTSSKLKVTM